LVIIITTPRLVLRRWREDDIAPMSAINADPEVMRWIGDGSIRDVQQTKAGIEASEHEWNLNGFGLFALQMRTTGELTGFSGLSVPGFLPEVMPAVEIGWRLGRPFWGQGLATEAARAALRFGLIDRGLERIVSIAQVGNDASERIMVKLGMHLERETVDPTCDRPVRVHAITKAEYIPAGRPNQSAARSAPHPRAGYSGRGHRRAPTRRHRPRERHLPVAASASWRDYDRHH
jgi:RimJ/RimL family protein N-acetyltransferase